MTRYLFDWFDKSVDSFQYIFYMSRISGNSLQLRTEYVVKFFHHLTITRKCLRVVHILYGGRGGQQFVICVI